MARFDLTDFEWSVIVPLLPTKVSGVARVNDRLALNGIFWRLRTGPPRAGNEDPSCSVPERDDPNLTPIHESLCTHGDLTAICSCKGGDWILNSGEDESVSSFAVWTASSK